MYVKYETSRFNPFQNLSTCNVVVDRTYVVVTGAEIKGARPLAAPFFSFF